MQKFYPFLFFLLLLHPLRAGQHVFVIHGYGGHPILMEKLAGEIRNAGFEVSNWRYHSLRDSLPEIALQLQSELLKFSAEDTIHFVTHSMGGLVVRTFFELPLPAEPLPPMGRLVMLTPPNQGAEIADFAANIDLNEWIFGRNVVYMRTDSTSFAHKLAVPPLEFGIIAGARDSNHGYNIFISGDDDGFLSVPRTFLEGAKDFIILPEIHQFIIRDRQSLYQVVFFLKNGRFDHSQPGLIPGPPAEPAAK